MVPSSPTNTNPSCGGTRQTGVAGGIDSAALPEHAGRFVALSCFAVANGMTPEMHQAFQSRRHLVDSVPGFVRMDVLSPSDAPDEVWLLTYWEDEPSFRAWHRSHLYHESHKGIPRGLKLVPGRTKMRFFEHVGS